ncbi:acetyltransferase [Polaromonas sp. YR568]|uniref:acetyltransferase n=1 Tax=Polaromonas sp. YR568 TaxID=1855301 RepID=UPI00398C1909
MKRIAVIGAGLLGRQIAHYIKTDQAYEPVGFFDDHVQSATDGMTVLGTVNDVEKQYAKGAFDQLVVGIGYAHSRYRWQCYERFKPVIPFLTFVHSSCWVDETARIGAGSFLMPRCNVADHVALGENVLLQMGCSINHHARIDENCFLGPGVTLAGCVTVGRDCFLGAGSVLIDWVNIAPGVQTGGGAVVIDSLPAPGLYVGVPAKKIK